MPSIGSKTATDNAGGSPHGGRRLRRTIALLGLAGMVFVAGFLWFVRGLPLAEQAPSQRAEGIVVLTGSAFRIKDAVELLAGGYGRRLLITGVHPTTRSAEIASLMPEYQRWFTCCIDLGHSAINTIGNAIETRGWAREQGFKSLIVVTSNFHLPRAMAELGHQLPDVTLVPFPVVSERLHVASWWSYPATARLLFSEYLKYIVAVARIRLEYPFA